MSNAPELPPPPPAVLMMKRLGLQPDPWQIEVLKAGHPRLLLNCCRQAGKTTVVGLLGLAEALFRPGTKVLLLAPSFRQASEMFRTMVDYHQRLGERLKLRCNAHELRLVNGSRIICLPCKEETVRGYSSVNLLVIDEAARVPDNLYKAVRPMLAVSGGKLICLSTPRGRQGFFWDAWANGGGDWARIEVPATKVPRISAKYLEEERRTLGEWWYRQEFCCSFEALEGLVYPDFAACVVPGPAPMGGKRVGGLDFGFRNPFAAVWGVLDRDGILWLTGEHYCRGKPLSYHAQQLPREVMWYADPSGANERTELIYGGFKVREGINALGLGIAAVNGRLHDGALKIVAGTCPNLLREATLYRYETTGPERRAEVPHDANNHALAALRYLISRLDERRLARQRRPPSNEPPSPPPPPEGSTGWGPAKDRWLSVRNEALWTRL
jgi:Terminase large subunit, T4likevirus-type, N-terminal